MLVARRSGCKVGWETYNDEAEVEEEKS